MPSYPSNDFDRRAVAGLVLWLVLCFTAASLGAVFLPGEWYGSLKKPSWTPPAWIFGPVWTALYASMAVAAWLIWRRGALAGAWVPLSLFGLQLALNLAWTGLFFALRMPGSAFGEILLLWVSILATLGAFGRISRLAAG